MADENFRNRPQIRAHPKSDSRATRRDAMRCDYEPRVLRSPLADTYSAAYIYYDKFPLSAPMEKLQFARTMFRLFRKYFTSLLLLCSISYGLYSCSSFVAAHIFGFKLAVPGPNLGRTWNCVDGICVKSEERTTSTSDFAPTLDACRLTCGPYAALWPKPTKLADTTNELVVVHPDDIRFEINEPVREKAPDDFKELVNGMCEMLVRDLKRMCGKTCAGPVNARLLVKMSIENVETDLTWYTDESYSLFVESAGAITIATIGAKSAYGARHGLQTLSQLTTVVSHSNASFVTMIKRASIADAPVYPHRGLLIDTSRHFLTVETIKRTLDGMAQSKLNVLHWHATDTHSFPLKLPRVPELAEYGAYSNEKTYSADDIRQLVSYGRKRGVRIIMEIDSPAHAGNGWQWGPRAGLGNLAVCLNRMPWRSYCIQPPCGTLNPVNSNTYKILGLLYKDLLQIFPKGEILHMGGDELKISCWNSTAEIVDFMRGEGMGRETEDFLRVWSYFHNKAKHVLDSISGNENPTILWTSRLTNPEYIEKYLDKKKFVIQAWTDTSEDVSEELLSKGYRMIISTRNAWYLDHGFWGSTSYYKWETVYDNKIPPPSRGVYGGEVCMWGELADDSAIDAKIWPRAAAVAERLWSNPSTRENTVVYRLLQQRRRLTKLGIRAEAVIPEWCGDNEGMCE